MSRLKSRVGETNTSFEGQLMTIITYRSNKDIDIKFEDGIVVTNKHYTHFKSGTIKNPHKDALERVGESNTATNGQRMTILAYHSYDNIDIRFEDGTIVLNKGYSEFKKGTILNPNAKTKESVIRLGETSLSSKGELMTLEVWRGSSDIDIRFEDNTLVCNKTYANFKAGLITNPNFSSKKYIGLTSRHRLTGMTMTIIAFRSCSDIDVKFEDGFIAYNKSVQNFKKGEITYSSLSRIGETKLANNGLYMEIVDYKANNDMTVKFEDGTLVSTYYSSFKTGNIKHPAINLTKKGYFGSSSELYGFRLVKLAYIYEGVSYFICECKVCGYRDILTVQEMKEHKCEVIK